ncbi:MAG: stage II sporulation protein R [Lachnospiraceae bacterium]|nr:stage II sporulation protein R [Lachnospiraceae bacterium]
MKNILKIGLILMITYVFAMEYGVCKQEAIAEGIAGKIIRFHVVANSDGPIDQELKLKVRDAVGVYMQEKLSGITDISKSRLVIKENLGEIENQARKVLEEEGCGYPVRAELKVTEFPEKTYGQYTFQAGEYEALELVIGSGKGHNWWCVMYPNLCFFNSVYQVVGQEAEKSLERVLTQEEYESLMEQKNYKVKSALWEWVMDKF